jgi:catechol 2,3-dioxygenase-like lactoylglutathione lyase family enzyme
MITGIHGLIYSDDPDATRAFLRDVLGWLYVEDESTGPGWLIFNSGPSELGVHPTSGTYEGQEYASPRHHSISLACDDLESTMSDLRAKGARFGRGVDDYGFGPSTDLEVPGADPLLLYQPSYRTAFDV